MQRQSHHAEKTTTTSNVKETHHDSDDEGSSQPKQRVLVHSRFVGYTVRLLLTVKTLVVEKLELLDRSGIHIYIYICIAERVCVCVLHL